MRRLALVFGVLGCLSGAASAQADAASSAQSARGLSYTTHAPAAPAASSGASKRVEHVSLPPPSVVAHGQAMHSTAQTAAAKKNTPPLTALPAFAVSDAAGASVASKDFARKGHWLLLYERNNCLPCDSVLSKLAASARPQMKRGAPMVIIVAVHSAAELGQFRSLYPELADATWLADLQQEASKALKVQASPMMYAMHGAEIEFNIPGTAGDPATVETMAGTWLTRVDHIDSTSTAAEATTMPPAAAAK